jgi:hypothetical protein
MAEQSQDLSAPAQGGHDELAGKTPVADFERRRFGAIEHLIETTAASKDIDQDMESGLPRR